MIQISNLTKDYGVTRALDGVSFSVDSGEILGLLGPNGAGKTTTMRIVTGYLTPTAGTVRVQEMDVAENPLAVKRLIGYLPEFAPLYADMVVHDYLQYVGAVRRLDPNRRGARIRAMTELCGLGDVIHRPFRELSRGYKQRVGLAHAMLSDPDILILDEPTSGLDPNQIVEIRSIIKEAGREKTVIFSTHILSEAESTCDRIVIINRGRVVADGTAALVKARAVSGMVVRLALLDAPLDEVQRHLLAVPGVDRVQRVLNAPLPAAGAPAGGRQLRPPQPARAVRRHQAPRLGGGGPELGRPLAGGHLPRAHRRRRSRPRRRPSSRQWRRRQRRLRQGGRQPRPRQRRPRQCSPRPCRLRQRGPRQQPRRRRRRGGGCLMSAAFFRVVTRELRAAFGSPVAYIVIVIFLTVTGWFFFTPSFSTGAPTCAASSACCR